MKKPLVSIIAAIGENRELGRDNKLLWQIPEDMKHFRDLTTGHPVLMGRKTFESIGRPLPKRANIIITRNPEYEARGCLVAPSLATALALAKQSDQEEVFIIGGGEIYKQALDLADKLYLTVVRGEFAADTFFPAYQAFGKVVSKKDVDNGEYQFSFLEIKK